MSAPTGHPFAPRPAADAHAVLTVLRSCRADIDALQARVDRLARLVVTLGLTLIVFVTAAALYLVHLP